LGRWLNLREGLSSIPAKILMMERQPLACFLGGRGQADAASV
jgi:hypothetical protein